MVFSQKQKDWVVGLNLINVLLSHIPSVLNELELDIRSWLKEKDIYKSINCILKKYLEEETNLHLAEWIPRSAVYKQLLSFLICTYISRQNILQCF